MKTRIFLISLFLIFFSIGTATAQQYTCSSPNATRLYAGGQYWVVTVDSSTNNTVNVGLQIITDSTPAKVSAIAANTVTIWLQPGSRYWFEQGTESIYCLTTSGTANVGVTVRKQRF